MKYTFSSNRQALKQGKTTLSLNKVHINYYVQTSTHKMEFTATTGKLHSYRLKQYHTGRNDFA